MEFNEKLQQLRKQKNLTQEQLAELLYVSRTAISKWETGKGHPNIESLKSIAKIFDISIDELLSGDQIIDIAVTENKSNMNNIFGYIYGILDLMAILFIILPLYGQPTKTYIESVNLFNYSNTTQTILTIYWITFILIIVLGVMQLYFLHFEKEELRKICAKISFLVVSLAIIFFSATREPYATALLFLFFFIKVITMLKETKIK